MAGSDFNITAQIHLQAPNAKSFSRDLQKQLKNPKVSVDLQGGPKTVQGLNKIAKATKEVEKETQRAGKGADYMGRQLGSAFKQIVKYDIARRIFSLFADAIESGVRDAIAFERAMVKVAQVSSASAGEMRNLEQSIGRVAKQFGVSSASLARTTLILKQTGLTISDTRIAMEALAKTELAPTFDNITDTAEMAIAAMRQFGIEASKLEGLLGRINVVAANFAVEASDIGVAIRRAGGSFKAAGGQIEELIALFTSVRSTTRETAETIATGFRTIFTRLQRPTTLKFLRKFGIELTDLHGKFVGPYEAVKRLHGALKGLDPKDVRFSMIVEQLGGFRQVSKVIPLIQQFGTAQAALNMQQAESGSLASDAAKAQATLAVQIMKLTENVKELFREIVASDTFQMMAKGAIALANAIVKVGKALAPVIPLVTAMMGMKMAGWAMGSMKMMGGRGLMAATGSMGGGGGMGGAGAGFNRGGRVKRFSGGGWVPGSGNGDTVPAMLEPGEFVLKKSAAQAFGPNLSGINKYAQGDIAKVNKLQKVHDGDSFRIQAYPSRGLFGTSTRLMGYDAAENNPSGRDRFAEFGLAGKHPADLAKTIFEKYKKGRGEGLKAQFFKGDGLGKPYGVSTDGRHRPLFSAPALGKALTDAGASDFGGVGTKGASFDIKAYVKKVDDAARAGGDGAYPHFWKTKDGKKVFKGLTGTNTGAGKGKEFASGGMVPSLLTPGEFVVNKKSAQSFGYGKLRGMNKYASGGAVRRYAGGTGGSGVLPMGMGGGGMGSMMPMMMMQMSGMGDMMGKTTKATKGAVQGLTNVATSATMAYTKFQFITQSVGAFAGMLGLGGDAMDAFINRVAQVGGVMAVAFDILSNPAAQKGVSKAADYAMMAMMMFGGKLKGVTKLIPGGAKAAAGGMAAKVGIGAGFGSKWKATYSPKYRKGLVEKASTLRNQSASHIGDAAAYKKTGAMAQGIKTEALGTQKTALAKQLKAQGKLTAAKNKGAVMQKQLNHIKAQELKSQAKWMSGKADFNQGSYVKDQKRAWKSAGGKPSQFVSNRGASSMKMSGKSTMRYEAAKMRRLAAEKRKLKPFIENNAAAQLKHAGKADDAGKIATIAGKRVAGAESVIGHTGKSAANSLKMAKSTRAASKASLLLAKNGVKLAKALTGVGIVALIAEESIGYFGRSMEEAAHREISESGGTFRAGQEEAIVNKAGTGGMIAGAATGAGIGAAIGLLTGPFAVVMTPLLAIVGGAVGAVWGWMAAVEGAKEAIEKAKFDKASKDMADAMKNFSEGTVTASFAMSKIVAMQQNIDDMKDFGVGMDEIFGKKAENIANAKTLVSAEASEARTMDEFRSSGVVQTAQDEGFVSPEFIEEQEKLVESNIAARDAMDSYIDAQRAANKELRKLTGYLDVFPQLHNKLSNFGSNIENLATPGSGAIGKTADLFNKAGTGKEGTAKFNKAIDMFGNAAGGNSLGGFGQKAKDANFVSNNIEDILLRSAATSGGLGDDDQKRDVILKDLKQTVESEGAGVGGGMLGDYMQKRMEDMVAGIDEKDLADLEGNASKIAEDIKKDQENFLEVFKGAAELLDKYTEELSGAYAAKLKLEQEYITRQQSLQDARFNSEQKYQDNLSASEYGGTSNADVQGNFMAKQRMLVEGVNGIGGMSADRQASLAAAGGVGSVDAVGKTFRDISKELKANQAKLIDRGIDPDAVSEGMVSGETGGLFDATANLIEKQSQLTAEYDSAKKILESYANSQERLTALNKELERAQAKRKTLKELAVQARYGTAEEKDQAARLINAITIASQQGIDAVAPELQRQVVGYMPQVMGAQGEAIVNQGINDAYGGGRGIAGITEVSGEEKRLATEIKAIEDAGIVAGEHLAEEVGDRIKDMADAIKELNKNFIVDMRKLFLEQREKQAKADLRMAESEVSGFEDQQKMMEQFGIKGTVDAATGELSYSEQERKTLNNLKAFGAIEDNMKLQEKQDTAYGGKDISAVMDRLGGNEKLLDSMVSGVEGGLGGYKQGAQNMYDDMAQGGGVLSTGWEGVQSSFTAVTGVGAVSQEDKDVIIDITGLSKKEFRQMQSESQISGENFDLANFNDGEMSAAQKMVDNIAEKYEAAGGSKEDVYKKAQQIAATAGAEGQDLLGGLVRMLADAQKNAGTGLDKQIKQLEDAGVDPDVIKELQEATPEDRKKMVEDAMKTSANVTNLDDFAKDRNQSYKDMADAKTELQDINTASAKLTAEATNRGSIYTHDVHLEKILLNILSVLEGGGRVVDLDDTSKNLLTGGSGAHDISDESKLLKAKEEGGGLLDGLAKVMDPLGIGEKVVQGAKNLAGGVNGVVGSVEDGVNDATGGIAGGMMKGAGSLMDPFGLFGGGGIAGLFGGGEEGGEPVSPEVQEAVIKMLPALAQAQAVMLKGAGGAGGAGGMGAIGTAIVEAGIADAGMVLGGMGGAVGAAAIPVYLVPGPGSAAAGLAGAAGVGGMAVDQSAAFMSQYGGKSLDQLGAMATDGGLSENFMSDLDASSLSDATKEAIKETVNGADSWMMGNSGVGAYGASDEGGTLSEAMGSDFISQAVSKAISEISTGSAASSIATQMMAIIDTSALTDVTDIFSKNIGEFGTAMGSPLNIEVGGSIEVNVNMSGAEFLKDAGGALAEMAGGAASKAINNFIKSMNKSSNVKPNPNGWHESGQPKPLTGNATERG
jgi:TP901 family phage tail tape measure protein